PGGRNDSHRATARTCASEGRRPMIGILVVDDHPLFRDGLAALLATIEDTEVVGLAGDGAAALELARLHTPDVVVIDLNMPGLPGLEAISRLVRLEPSPAVL